MIFQKCSFRERSEAIKWSILNMLQHKAQNDAIPHMDTRDANDKYERIINDKSSESNAHHLFIVSLFCERHIATEAKYCKLWNK